MWIHFKFSKSWKVLISKYCLGSASPLVVSSPPDFDTNNLIEKSGRGTGAKNRERKKRRSIYFSRQQPSEKVEESHTEKATSCWQFVWGDFKTELESCKPSPPNRWFFFSLKYTFNGIVYFLPLMSFWKLLLYFFFMLANIWYIPLHKAVTWAGDFFDNKVLG